MVRVCPQPMAWQRVYQGLLRHAERHPCTPPKPPVPLILNGWAFTNDVEKMGRWREMVDWAMRNGCPALVQGIPDDEFFFVDEPTSYDLGPMGGPMYRSWDFDAKGRPGDGDLQAHLDMLMNRWKDIAGPALASATKPVKFSGAKARRLVVAANFDATPPWGSWTERSTVEAERRTFTRLRNAINKAIAPHEVDHVTFHTELWPARTGSDAAS